MFFEIIIYDSYSPVRKEILRRRRDFSSQEHRRNRWTATSYVIALLWRSRAISLTEGSRRTGLTEPWEPRHQRRWLVRRVRRRERSEYDALTTWRGCWSPVRLSASLGLGKELRGKVSIVVISGVVNCIGCCSIGSCWNKQHISGGSRNRPQQEGRNVFQNKKKLIIEAMEGRKLVTSYECTKN